MIHLYIHIYINIICIYLSVSGNIAYQSIKQASKHLSMMHRVIGYVSLEKPNANSMRKGTLLWSLPNPQNSA
jgi:hypothetical protein